MKTCEHLEPLVTAIEAAGLTLTRTDSPYGGDAIWWSAPCTFVESALRKRLGLAPSLSYVEYNGMSAGSDATWSCKEHDIVIIGPHPSFAAKGTPRLR